MVHLWPLFIVQWAVLSLHTIVQWNRTLTHIPCYMKWVYYLLIGSRGQGFIMSRSLLRKSSEGVRSLTCTCPAYTTSEESAHPGIRNHWGKYWRTSCFWQGLTQSPGSSGQFLLSQESRILLDLMTFICFHYRSYAEMVTLRVPSYQCQLGTNIQKPFKCSGIPFSPVCRYSCKWT
jgi:hypothetical protein